MIDLYYWPTPNGHKITLSWKRRVLRYRIFPIEHQRRRSVPTAFLAFSSQQQDAGYHRTTNRRMPQTGRRIRVGAILVYLADQVGAFLPTDFRHEDGNGMAVCRWAASVRWRDRTIIFGQYAPEKIPTRSAIRERDQSAVWRARSLGWPTTSSLAGADYPIADMAAYSWIVPLEAFSNRTSTISRTSVAGSNWSKTRPRQCAPTQGRAVFEQARRHRAGRRSCSADGGERRGLLTSLRSIRPGAPRVGHA